MPDVFLSYASEDRERARTVAEAFEAEGWSVWWDRSIDAGESFSDAITAAIEGATCVVVLWSAVSVRSSWVRDEASAGKARDALVPASLDGSAPPLGFRQIHTAPLEDWDGDHDHAGFVLLRDGVAARLAAGPQRGPDVQRPPRRRRRVPRWATPSGIGGLLGAILLLAVLLVTDNVHPRPTPSPTPPPSPQPTPYPGGILASRVNAGVPELGCRSWDAGDEASNPNPFHLGVAVACVSREVGPDAPVAAVPELDLYLFAPVGPLEAYHLRDAFWALKIYGKGLTRNGPGGTLCLAGTCGCPFGVPGEGTYPKLRFEYPPRISCGYSDGDPSYPELRWTNGKQLYARIIFRKIPRASDPSPVPGASPGRSPEPAATVRPDQRIIDLYQWWLLNHREIEAASEGVVPLPVP